MENLFVFATEHAGRSENCLATCSAARTKVHRTSRIDKSQSVFRTIVRNLSANYIGVAGQILVAFMLTPFVIRTLGDEMYGIWTIIAALGAYLTLCDVGVVSAITKYISHGNKLQDKGHVTKVISCAAVIVLPITLFIFLLSPFTGQLLLSLIHI